MSYKRVYSTFNPGEIPVIKSILEEDGIDYFVTNEWSAGIYPHATGMDVMAEEAQAERARELIEDFKKNTGKETE